MLGFIKLGFLRPGSGSDHMPPDEKHLLLNLYNTLGVPDVLPMMHPRLYPLHKLPFPPSQVPARDKRMHRSYHVCCVAYALCLYLRIPSYANCTSACALTFWQPLPIRLQQEQIEAHGMYLLDAGYRWVVWISRAVSPAVLSAYFNARLLDEVDSRELLNNPPPAFTALMTHLIRERDRRLTPSFHVLKQGDIHEHRLFVWALIEDRPPGASQEVPTYVDLLVQLHKEIQHKIN
jgi:hypothetical protein